MSYRIERVASARSADFAEAYAALAAEFAPRGELERRAVVERWLDDADGADRTYHLLVARDAHGALAGVRDCHVVLDRDAAIVVVYLAHVLVLPPYRRSGLSRLLREAPIAIARRIVGGIGIDAEILLAAEMEHPSADDEASLVRLVAYGKDGFSAISPAALPYAQPDFRDLALREREPVPIPLLAVVRWLGHEGAASLPVRLARAFVSHLHAVFATHVAPDHLADLRARALDALDASGAVEVPLVPLPRATDDRDALALLSPRSIHEHPR